MDMSMTAAPDLLEWIWAVFEGEPGCGSREVRLSDEEAEAVRQAWPSATLTLLSRSGGEKNWYTLSFSSFS